MKRLAAGFFIALLACNCDRAAPPPAASPAPEPPRSALEQRLHEEAAARPPGTLRVEDVVAKLGTAGVVVTRVRQVLAEAGARYCATVLTAGEGGVSVCEFESPESARAGERRSHELYDGILPGRRLVVAQSTLVTVPEAKSSARLIAALSL